MTQHHNFMGEMGVSEKVDSGGVDRCGTINLMQSVS